MREKLISWLLNDIIPDVKTTRDPHASIIKFSNANNLAAGQVEALGQLFNTAKTLSYLEKTADNKRGASFPILDVPAMMDDYLSVKSTKSASVNVQFESDCGGDDLPACFRVNEEPLTEVAILADPSWNRTPEKKASIERDICKVCGEFAEQAKFEALEERLKLASSIAQTLREYPEIDFEKETADALFMHGEFIRPGLEKLAAFVKDTNYNEVKVAAVASDDLVEDRYNLMSRFLQLGESDYKIESAMDLIKASAVGYEELEKVAAATATANSTSTGQSSQQQNQSGQKGRYPNNVKKKNDGDQSEGKSNGKSEGKSHDDYFGGVNKLLDNVFLRAAPAVGQFAQKHLLEKDNKDQRTLDRSHLDTQHLAVLHRLMATDDVLAEADPEKVVDIFNTVRENAPDLAGDANVMRAILRTAVQHEGISPFDLNTLLETQISKHKVQTGQRQLDDQTYKGKPVQAPAMQQRA